MDHSENIVYQYVNTVNNEGIVIEEDTELKSLLTSWNLEILYPKLIECCINVECLKHMKEKHVNQLFTKDMLGFQILFEKELYKWQKEIGTLPSPEDNTLSLNTSVSEWIRSQESTQSTSSSVSDQDVDIYSVLKTTVTGSSILEMYKETKHLRDEHRREIVECVVSYFINNNNKLSVSICNKVADQIINLFPSEKKETYFVKRAGRSPLGKLYDRYNNKLRKIRSIKIKDVSASSVPTPVQPSEDITHKISYLKHARDNLTEIFEAWKLTASFRRNFIIQNESSNCSDIMKEWPLYKHSAAPDLINIDFEYIHPDKSRCLFSKWDLFLLKITNCIKSTCKDLATLDLIKKIDDTDINECSKNCIITLCLHAVLVPTCRITNSKENTRKNVSKPSIKDSQDSFILHIKTVNDFNVQISHLENQKSQQGLTLQPILVILGDSICCLKEFYVCFDGHKYKYISFLSALDSCFKLYQVFNISYPKEGQLVWQFIQNYIYEIKTVHDIRSPKLATIINDLGKL